MNKSGLLLICLIHLCCLISTRAQQAAVELSVYLKQLEQTHNVHFNYVTSQTDQLKFSVPTSNTSLDSALAQIQAAFNLSIDLVSEDYYLIKAKISRACGTVTTVQGKPIAGVVVQTNSHLTTTNEKGYFSIHVTDQDSLLTFSHLSYHPQQLAILRQPAACLELTLIESVQTLEALLVQNYVAPGISKTKNGAIALNLGEIGLLAGMAEADVLHSLQVLPGVQSYNETVSHLNIRGASNDQHHLSWEGMRLYQPGHFFGLITAINPQMTREVKLYKNGTPAKYGGSTAGQVIMNASPSPANAVEAGINLLHADAYLSLPVDEQSQLQLAVRSALPISTPTYQRYYERAFGDTEVRAMQDNPEVLQAEEYFNFQDISVKFRHEFNKYNTLFFKGLYIDNELTYKQRRADQSRDEFKESALHQGSLLLGLSHEYSKAQWTLASSFSTSSYLLSASNYDVTNDQQLDQENEVIDLTWREELSWQLSDNFTWRFGGEMSELGVRNFREVNRPQVRSDIKDVMRILAPYSSVRWSTPSRATSLYGGLRTAYFTTLEKWTLEPRLSMTQRITDQLFVDFQAERKSQHLTQIIDFQDDFLGVEKRKWVLADESTIPLLVSNQFSVGPSYEGRHLLIGLEGFYRQINGVASASQGFQNQFERARVAGETTSFGTELLVNPQFDRLTAWGSYAWMRNRYYFGELVPPEFRSNFDIRHQLSLGIKYQSGGLSLSTAANWHTGRPYTPLRDNTPNDSQQIAFGIPNSENLPYYFRWDFSASYKKDWSEKISATAGFSLWNLTNRSNIVNTYFIHGDDGVRRVNNLALGFTPNVFLRMFFM